MRDPRRPYGLPPGDDPPPVPEGVVRVDAILGLPSVLLDLGLDPASTIAAAGLDPRLFEDPRHEIPIASLGRLIALAAARSGCADVGLRVGERSDPTSLGLVGLLAQHAPDVGTALRVLTAHLHLRDRAAVAPLLVSHGVASLGYELCQADVEAGDQICDGGLAVAMNVMRVLCGPGWRPSEVLFAHRAPADTRLFRRVFDAPLHFDAERTALVFPANCLERKARRADPALFGELMRRVDDLESHSAVDLPTELRRMLRVALLSGKGSVGDVASRIGMHRRTLNRRLAAHGTSLRHLIDSTRFQIARQLVANTDMPMVEIATALGYADASAFTRAFRRWAGGPPSAWRRELLSAG